MLATTGAVTLAAWFSFAGGREVYMWTFRLSGRCGDEGRLEEAWFALWFVGVVVGPRCGLGVCVVLGWMMKLLLGCWRVYAPRLQLAGLV